MGGGERTGSVFVQAMKGRKNKFEILIKNFFLDG
jgi:hypothetical protein